MNDYSFLYYTLNVLWLIEFSEIFNWVLGLLGARPQQEFTDQSRTIPLLLAGQ